MAMREVLFRGKLSTGEWIEGFYSAEEYDIDIKEIMHIPRIQQLGKCMSFGIIPETRGEFTGLTDKNSVKIFEGDILQSRASEIQSEWKYWKVEYLDGSFVFSHSDIIYRKKRKYEENLLCADNIELYRLYVIGNIFDNPELMGGAEK